MSPCRSIRVFPSCSQLDAVAAHPSYIYCAMYVCRQLSRKSCSPQPPVACLLGVCTAWWSFRCAQPPETQVIFETTGVLCFSRRIGC